VEVKKQVNHFIEVYIDQ